MSTVFSTEDNLPGVITEVENDYSSGYDTSQFGTTDSVVIIGTAFDGPVGTPIPVYSPEHGIYVFGKTYDSEKRQEASLVAGIQDAWDRGCRTIYAVRIGGKELHKDFNFAIDSKYKLRVASRYPSNIGKQVYMRYDNTVGNETLVLYKPSGRATIAEKKRGEVDGSNSVMTTEIRLAMDYGLGKDANLVEAIRLFNENDANNVMELSIVDENGVDVTDSTEAYTLPVGVLFPGVYFMGRDDSKCSDNTKTKLVIADGTTPTPYSNFDKQYFRKLEYNTDVAQAYPIYFTSAQRKNFSAALLDTGITMSKPWDFLEVANLSSRAFAPDTIDYEETNLSTFETYRRLGGGFAITAKATKRTSKAGIELPPRITETPMDDANRVTPILDGIYGVLQDAEIKYRVLTNVDADDKISSKLPRAKDFETTVASTFSVLKDCVALTPKVAADDRTAEKKYTIAFNKLAEAVTDTITDAYTDEVFPIISSVSAIGDIKTGDVKVGEQIIVIDATNGNTLYRVNVNGDIEKVGGTEYVGKHFIINSKLYEGVQVSGKTDVEFKEVAFTAAANGKDALFNSKEYILGETLNTVFVFQPQADNTVKPLGDLNTMLGDTANDNAAMLLVHGQSLPYQVNNVVINSVMFDNMTLGELVEALNSHPVIEKIFKADLTDTGSQMKDYMVSDAMDEIGATVPNGLDATIVLGADRRTGYDYNRYIPYRTTDNFARQLAQHCTYTELKTTPAHGFIGCARQTDVSLSAIANRVAQLSEINFDLYAKNNSGRNMLDRNNYPYAIGKNVSVIFGQYFVNMENENYRFLSTGGAGYAGMVSTLPLDQSSTSQHIEINSVTFRLTPSQLVKMTKQGIVTFKESFTKGIVITDGITMAPVDSSFRRLAAWRIMGAIEDLIREAAEPYIGKQNHVTNRNSLYTAIKSRLEKVKGTLIEVYEFNMVVDPKLLKFSYINVTYTIVPIYEIREIRNQISVKDSLDSATTVVS